MIAQAYEGPLPARAANEVKTDVTIRERLVLPLAERAVVRGYDEYEDLPDGAMMRVYSLDEIAVEKIVALGDRARDEPRDLYDAWYLTREGYVDLAGLRAEIERKLEFRGRTLATVGEELRKKEARLERLWTRGWPRRWCGCPRSMAYSALCSAAFLRPG